MQLFIYELYIFLMLTDQPVDIRATSVMKSPKGDYSQDAINGAMMSFTHTYQHLVPVRYLDGFLDARWEVEVLAVMVQMHINIHLE